MMHCIIKIASVYPIVSYSHIVYSVCILAVFDMTGVCTCFVEGVKVHVVEVLPARPVDAGVGEEGKTGQHCHHHRQQS